MHSPGWYLVHPGIHSPHMLVVNHLILPDTRIPSQTSLFPRSPRPSPWSHPPNRSFNSQSFHPPAPTDTQWNIRVSTLPLSVSSSTLPSISCSHSPTQKHSFSRLQHTWNLNHSVSHPLHAPHHLPPKHSSTHPHLYIHLSIFHTNTHFTSPHLNSSRAHLSTYPHLNSSSAQLSTSSSSLPSSPLLRKSSPFPATHTGTHLI